MATVTITLKDLQFIYCQLNFLRNYLGVYSSNPMEHVISVNLPPIPASVSTSASGTTDETVSPTAEEVEDHIAEDVYEDAEDQSANEEEAHEVTEEETDEVTKEETDEETPSIPIRDAPLITNFYGRLLKQMSYVIPAAPSVSEDSDD